MKLLISTILSTLTLSSTLAAAQTFQLPHGLTFASSREEDSAKRFERISTYSSTAKKCIANGSEALHSELRVLSTDKNEKYYYLSMYNLAKDGSPKVHLNTFEVMQIDERGNAMSAPEQIVEGLTVKRFDDYAHVTMSQDNKIKELKIVDTYKVNLILPNGVNHIRCWF